jgi:hypothetical protein
MLSIQVVPKFAQSVTAFAAVLVFASLGFAQDNNGGGNNNGGNNNGGQNNVNINTGVAGVEIDPQGVLRVAEVDAGLAFEQRMATLQSLGPKASVTSPMRKISLNRLEKYVAECLDRDQQVDEDALSLAGLTRIEYVFFLPDSNDIVIAGPAEKLHTTADNRWVGLKSGKSVLRLVDLVVALRAFGPGQDGTLSIGCSIDPTEEGIKRMNRYHSQFAGQADRVNVQELMMGMKQTLGYQNVSIRGVPRDTHFAQILVEADYRMKLIGIGLENPMIPMTTWIQRTQPGANSNALQRWYFEADYSSVAVNPEGTALRLKGRGVKLTGEKEFVAKNGKRTRGGGSGDVASQGFTKEFTEKFEALGEAIPVFSELRSLFDMSIAAAFIQERDLYAKSGWQLGVFADEAKLNVTSNPTITQVESAVNAVWKNGQLITPIGGGVHIAARKLVAEENVSVDRAIDGQSSAMSAPSDLREGQWWWD